MSAYQGLPSPGPGECSMKGCDSCGCVAPKDSAVRCCKRALVNG